MNEAELRLRSRSVSVARNKSAGDSLLDRTQLNNKLINFQRRRYHRRDRRHDIVKSRLAAPEWLAATVAANLVNDVTH